MRVAVLSALLIWPFAGCADRSPETVRLPAGSQAIVYDETRDRIALVDMAKRDFFFVPAGTKVTILADEDGSKLQAPEGEAASGDHRKVRFTVAEGEHVGTVVTAHRHTLRPVPK